MGGPRALTAELLFVYGTLRRGGGAGEMLGAAESRGPAVFRGKLYDLGTYPGAVPSDDPADAVQGELFRLPAELLERLDRYEGTEFHRGRAEVTLASGEAVGCWIYLYRGPLEGVARIASGDFLAPQQG